MVRDLGMLAAAEILPDNVLVRTPEMIVWWIPASVRPMFFSHDCDGKKLSGKLYPHPALVFSMAGNHDLNIRALFENQRPVRSSPIGVAPYWNTSPEGGVCLGSM